MIYAKFFFCQIVCGGDASVFVRAIFVVYDIVCAIFVVYATVRANFFVIRATFATLFTTFPAFATWCNVANAASLHSSFTADNLPYEQIGNQEPVCIADEVPFEIPEGWEWCRLSSLVSKEIRRGKSPKYSSKAGIQVFAQKCNVKSGGIDMTLAKYLDPAVFKKYPVEEYMQDQDIVINSTGNGTLGRIGVFKDTDRIDDSVIVPDSHVTVIRLLPSLDKAYILNVLSYYQPFLEKQGEGSTNQTELKPTIISNLLIPVPPAGEQLRISEMLTTTMPLIMKYGNKEIQLREYNDSFPDHLRKSILQYAVQGKLVPQDPDDEPASVLLYRIRAEKERLIAAGKIKRDKHESVIYRRDNSHYEKIDGIERCIDDEIPFEISESWCWVRLATLGEIVGGGTPKTGDMDCWNNGTIPWLTPADMKYVAGKYVSNGERYITEYGLQKSSATMMPMGTVVYSSRAPIGYIAIAANPLCTNQGFKSIVPVITGLSDYLYYCLMALTPEIQSRASGTTFKEISGSEFGKTLIPLPSLAEQSRIVLRTEALLAIVTTL